MGRPLKKSNFGNTSSTGPQLQVIANLGAGAETCWIINQKGSKTYTVASVAGGATPLRTGRVILQQGSPSQPGQAQLVVTPSNGSGGSLPAEHAKSLLAHVVKTWEGNEYDWFLGVPVASLTTGQAQVAYA